MHYLTDRHAAGHSFEKGGVLEAARDESWTARRSDKIANLMLKTVHDDYNESGIPVHDAAGESWTAYGDGHWNDAANRENRVRTATSVTTSWGELADINACEMPVEYSPFPDFAAHDTVPQWDPARQADAEARAREATPAGALWNVRGEAPDMLGMWAGQGADWLGEKADTAGSWFSDNVVDPVRSVPDRVGDWFGSAEEDIAREYGVPWF
jgi:hypothetical protein